MSPEPSRRRRRIAALLGGALVVAHFVVLRVLPSGSQAATNLSVATLILSALIAAASAGVTARRSSGRARFGWAILGVGMVGWAFGESVWATYVSFRHAEAPFPGIGDVGFLAMVPCAVAGMVSFLGLRRGLLRVLFDGLVIAGSLLFLSWAFVLQDVYRAGNLTAAAKTVSLAYPLSDVLLAAAALILLPRAARGSRGVAVLIAASALALSVGDLGFAYLNQHSTYTCGSPIDSGWVAGFVLIALAAHRAPSARQDPEQTAPALAWLPYLPLTLALLAAIGMLARGQRLSPLLSAVLGTVILLVIVRQMVALRENAILSRELRAAVTELHHLAYHDQLTGLANRALFLERAESTRADAVLYIDLDGFKPVNDRYGHATGDALLVAVGERLRAETREGDLTARLGGDEFAVLVSGPADELATRIVERIRTPFEIHGHTVTIGASVGVAVREPGEHGTEAMLRRADERMYEAKARGRALT